MCNNFRFFRLSVSLRNHYSDVIMAAIASQIVTGLCAWNTPGTGEFPAQMASNAKNVSIWWRHHTSWHHVLESAVQCKWQLNARIYIFCVGILGSNIYQHKLLPWKSQGRTVMITAVSSYITIRYNTIQSNLYRARSFTQKQRQVVAILFPTGIHITLLI